MKRTFKNTATYRSIKYARIRSARDESFSRLVQKYAMRTIYSILTLIVIFICAKHFLPESFSETLEPIAHDYNLMFSVFFISEAVLGLIPPDLFIMWAALETQPLLFISILAVLSYIGGIISFLLGRFIGKRRVFERIVYNVRIHYEHLILKWGAAAIILSALTPIPFSPVSMLTGSLKYPFKKYVFYSLTRLIRVIGYGLVFMLLE